MVLPTTRRFYVSPTSLFSRISLEEQRLKFFRTYRTKMGAKPWRDGCYRVRMCERLRENLTLFTSNIRLASKRCDVSLIAFLDCDIVIRCGRLVVAVVRPSLDDVSQFLSSNAKVRQPTIQFSAPSIVLKFVPCSGWKLGAQKIGAPAAVRMAFTSTPSPAKLEAKILPST